MSKKQYGPANQYEQKLEKVMERLGVDEYNWNWDRHGCWIEFRYRGELYRFDHSVDKAKARGVELRYGSDAFAQVVLALEDLARMVERGIYELSTWVAGMKYLPPPVEVPSFFIFLGFTQIPSGPETVRKKDMFFTRRAILMATTTARKGMPENILALTAKNRFFSKIRNSLQKKPDNIFF